MFTLLVIAVDLCFIAFWYWLLFVQSEKRTGARSIPVAIESNQDQYRMQRSGGFSARR
ncbi:MAG TPA: hypothetical protein PLC15_06060 [Candidatus Obscuribacter sp.]|nr:hypothetical protein [Candidatus Obscuribacter sp.]MBK9280042.1 hypothetical protein [Candidatus Obscuribacter sp.]HMY53342.1 hypothetical protein [Candidatus Obscuribacter sp.]HNB14923.1 hypothetical protein [Candidatus Obscuribacter sp.]HND08110.1 hypothetical protein [Candidatus Obscuribacter sp.]